jgi:hypothetical protein
LNSEALVRHASDLFLLVRPPASPISVVWIRIKNEGRKGVFKRALAIALLTASSAWGQDLVQNWTTEQTKAFDQQDTGNITYTLTGVNTFYYVYSTAIASKNQAQSDYDLLKNYVPKTTPGVSVTLLKSWRSNWRALEQTNRRVCMPVNLSFTLEKLGGKFTIIASSA